jgi:hypothetical protein
MANLAMVWIVGMYCITESCIIVMDSVTNDKLWFEVHHQQSKTTTKPEGAMVWGC